MEVRRNLIVTGASLIAIWSQANYALVLSPVRCADDNLPQWNHDVDPAHYDVNAPVEGTARGRQAWWKTCDPATYYKINTGSKFIGIDAEFDPTANHNANVHTRWYPTFGVITGYDQVTKELTFAKPGGYLAPTVSPRTSGDPACRMPAKFELVGMCASGCVTPDEKVSTPQADTPIAELEQEMQASVMVPMADGVYRPMQVQRFIRDGVDSAQKITVIMTRSGGRLRLSNNHPLLNKDFTMQHAESFKIGDSLIRADGSADEIIDAHSEDYFGKLHNLTVKTSDLEKSVYVVNGYVSGDKKFQDIQLSDVNRKIFRDLVK